MTRSLGILLLLTLLVVAFLLRLPGLTERELWVDEANSALIACDPPGEILTALTRDGNPPLYYLLLHVWQSVFGLSEGSVRGLSVFWGLVLVSLVVVMGVRWFGPLAGGAAGVFVAFSPLHVYYSREARMYAMLAVFALLAVGATERLLARRSRRWVIATTLGLVLCIYTHNYGLFLLPAGPLAALLIGPRRRQAVLLTGTASFLALLLALPWLPVVFRQAGTAVGDWIPDLFHQQLEGCPLLAAGPPGTVAAGLARSIHVMTPGAPYPFYLRKLPETSPTGSASLFVFAGLALLAFVPRRRAAAGEGGFHQDR